LKGRWWWRATLVENSLLSCLSLSLFRFRRDLANFASTDRDIQALVFFSWILDRSWSRGNFSTTSIQRCEWGTKFIWIFLVASWCLFSSKFSRGCAEIPEISSSSAVFEHCCRFLEFDYAGVIFPVLTFGFAIFVWEESGFSFHTICFVSFLVRFSSTSLLYTVLVCPAHGCANSCIFSFWNWQKENVESKSLWLHFSRE